MTTEPPIELRSGPPDAPEASKKTETLGNSADEASNNVLKLVPNTPIGTKRADTDNDHQSKPSNRGAAAMSPEMKLHSAKRRRIDAQNLSMKNRLTRPFRSPLKVASNGSAATIVTTEGTSGSPQATRSISSNGTLYSNKPTANTATKTPRRSTNVVIPTASASTSIKNPLFKSSFTTPMKSARPTAAANSFSDPVDAEVAALHKQLRGLEDELKEAKANLETAAQAVKIEESGEDKKLEELIVKWKLASQRTADHLFEIAEERVGKMGGVRVWKEMNERGQAGGSGSWGYTDQEGGGFGDGAEQIDPEQRAKLKEEYEAEYGVGDDDDEDEDNTGSKAEDEEFTMELMLKTLHIELNVIGFDKDYQRWN